MRVLEQAHLSDEQLIGTYKAQGGAERGFRFLKDPLFLASSVFVKKPVRIMALSFIMVLCLLVYRIRILHGSAQLPARKRSGSNGPMPGQRPLPAGRAARTL